MIDERFRGAVVALDAQPTSEGLKEISEFYSVNFFRGAELDAAVSESLPSGLTDESLEHLKTLGKSLYAILTPR
jgi:hypothetical protein